MSECIAMAIGFIMGAGCALISGSGQRTRRERNDTQVIPRDDTKGAGAVRGKNEREILQKQWENFLNYDGTGEGQMPIGDE